MLCRLAKQGEFLLGCLALLTAVAWAQPQLSYQRVSYGINTFAGLRIFGDGGPAVQTQLYGPVGVAVDGSGNLYIADRNNSIRKVDPTGTITTVAGTGEQGFSGDGGPAVQAQLASPTGVAVDGAGNLYIADSGNERIRKVDPTGRITTVAGTGERGAGGDGGPATQAQFAFPADVAVDGSDNLYIADRDTHRIRKVDPTGRITTIAGTGEYGGDGDGGPAVQAQLDSPTDVAVDGSGNLYIADKGTSRIRKVDSRGTITTVAGTRRRGGGGDGGPAVQAPLTFPNGVAVDGSGNLYIADSGNDRIRKVDSRGTITTVAGMGENGRGRGYSGDGGPAVEAQLAGPVGLAVDGSGNLYIADRGNRRIRKVDSRGRITTVAGTGKHGGDGGPAARAQLNSPAGVAVDGSGNLYIADRDNDRIRKVDSTGTITTVAGGGRGNGLGNDGPAVLARLNGPAGVAVDGSGNLYIADSNYHRIRKVDSTGTITAFAGTGRPGLGGDGGPALQAQLRTPVGVAVDSSGNLYIADRTHRIRKVDSAGTITTVAGGGRIGDLRDRIPAVEAWLDSPTSVAVDGSGNLYIADSGNDRIRKVDSEGTITTVAGGGEGAGSGDGGPATQARLDRPTSVVVDASVNLYIADRNNHRIRKVDSTGTITTIAGEGENGFDGDGGPAIQAQLASPTGVAVDGAGNLYLADQENHRIRQVDSAGTITTIAGRGEYGFGGYAGDGGPALAARLDSPTGVTVDRPGNLYLADRDNHRIRKVDSTGTMTTVAGMGEDGFGGDGGPAIQAQLDSPTGVTVDGSGSLYIADQDNHRIRKLDSTGTITTVAGMGEDGFDGDSGPATQAQLDSPTGMAVDGSGNLYIADRDNHRIRKVDSTGMITTVAGMGEDGFGGDGGPATQAQLDSPTGVAVDGSGNLYIADRGNRRIRKVDSAGTITTVAGRGDDNVDPAYGFDGDGGPALRGRLYHPTGVAVDGLGNLYIADHGNHSIRKVDSMGTITKIAGGRFEFPGFGGDGVPATAAQLAFPTAVAVDGSGNLYIADSGNHRIRILMPRYRLDFAHFANGASVTSDLVLVNVAPHPIRPAFYFYDKDGSLIAAESVIEVTGDLEVAEDGALTVRTEVEPLGELTISTHGQGEVVRGSVAVVANGPIGGVLRFDLPGVGVAGVGAGQPVRDAIFPARRQASGISTAAAIRILDDDREEMRCRLMQEGAVLEEVKLDLGGDRQEAQFIEEMFTATDTSDFVGLVRCTVSSSEVFVGVAVELDAANGIFTTLPIIALDQKEDGNKEVALEFAHFANGSSITSDLVLVNVAPHPIRPALYFYDRDGDRIAAQSVVEVQGELEVAEDGALTVQSELEPLQKLTISTNGQGEVVAGSVTVVADGPLGGVLRFDLPGVGVAGVGAGQPVRDAIFPARRQAGGISTAAAIRNPGEEELVVSCRLMQGGAVLEERDIDLKTKGQDGRFIHEVFTRTDTSNFVGSVRCTAPEGRLFTGVAVELDADNRIFTTLPLVPVPWMTAQE